MGGFAGGLQIHDGAPQPGDHVAGGNALLLQLGAQGLCLCMRFLSLLTKLVQRLAAPGALPAVPGFQLFGKGVHLGIQRFHIPAGLGQLVS